MGSGTGPAPALECRVAGSGRRGNGGATQGGSLPMGREVTRAVLGRGGKPKKQIAINKAAFLLDNLGDVASTLS